MPSNPKMPVWAKLLCQKVDALTESCTTLIATVSTVVTALAVVQEVQRGAKERTDALEGRVQGVEVQTSENRVSLARLAGVPALVASVVTIVGNLVISVMQNLQK